MVVLLPVHNRVPCIVPVRGLSGGPHAGAGKGSAQDGVINFGQFRLGPALSFEFGQFDDFSQFDFGGTTKCGLEGWGPKG